MTDENLSEDERKAFVNVLMRDSVQSAEARQNRVYSQSGDDYLIEAQRLCAEDKPKPPVMCPYCGHKMVHQYVYGDHFFRCPKCRAVAPDKDTEAEAYEAAMQCWKEPNRVLMLDEIKELRAVWVEDISRGIAPAIVFPNDTKNYSCVIADYDAPDDNVWFDNAEYGKHWRCWLRKPTQEEMEAVPWEGD